MKKKLKNKFPIKKDIRAIFRKFKTLLTTEQGNKFLK